MPRTNSNLRCAWIFFDVHMGKAHKGLLEHAVSHGYPVNNMPNGDLLLFFNSNFNKVKLLDSRGEVFCYLRTDGNPLAIRQIRSLPNIFGGPDLVLSNETRSKIASAIADLLEAKRRVRQSEEIAA